MRPAYAIILRPVKRDCRPNWINAFISDENGCVGWARIENGETKQFKPTIWEDPVTPDQTIFRPKWSIPAPTKELNRVSDEGLEDFRKELDKMLGFDEDKLA